MKPQTGIVLRLLGPLIEVVCAAIMIKTWGQGKTVLGMQLDSLLMAGFFVGLLMVVAGLTMVKKPGGRAKPPADLDLNLDRDRP
jgi:hypothetical protein